MTSCFKGKFKVTSIFGYRWLFSKKEFHGGLDLVGVDNSDVYAIADGVVDATPYEKDGFGFYVRQLLPDNRRIYYAHLKEGSICVKKGQKIKKGDKLGVMGSTGKSTGKHTHLEIRPAGTSKDSLDICEFTGIPNKTGTYCSQTKHELAYESACLLQDKCSFAKSTMDYLWNYKYADDLFIKLYEALNK